MPAQAVDGLSQFRKNLENDPVLRNFIQVKDLGQKRKTLRSRKNETVNGAEVALQRLKPAAEIVA
jgi:hypothetical protein